MGTFVLKGNLVDVWQRAIYAAAISVEQGIIKDITTIDEPVEGYVIPGFIDAHIHIESSMLVPTAFAQTAVVHGTVATVSDPHEIANVCGLQGVQYMLDNSKLTPFNFFFGAPSCVPATSFETAGATLGAEEVAYLMQRDDIWYLSEVMNYPGVLEQNAEVMAKIASAHAVQKPVDGHAPGLRGDVAHAYAAAGITTDHECFTLEEALDKVAAGMYILIREGSAAKNFEALHPLLAMHPDRVMFCSDDKHPDELLLGHINLLVQRAVDLGYDVFDVLRAACIHPVVHYKLPIGMLRVGDKADMLIVEDLVDFKVQKTYLNGSLVADHGKSRLPHIHVNTINHFNVPPVSASLFGIPCAQEGPIIRVIEAVEGQLVTNPLTAIGKVVDGFLVSDVAQDILKMAVVNRYASIPTAGLGFIKNIGLKQGAIATTVGHDCHNIIVVGTSDEAMQCAVNAVIARQGGIAVCDDALSVVAMSLPIAGLMSDQSIEQVSHAYTLVDQQAKALGSTLHAPFMTLSFMALLVIPALKLSDKGLFDGSNFSFVEVLM